MNHCPLRDKFFFTMINSSQGTLRHLSFCHCFIVWQKKRSVSRDVSYLLRTNSSFMRMPESMKNGVYLRSVEHRNSCDVIFWLFRNYCAFVITFPVQWFFFDNDALRYLAGFSYFFFFFSFHTDIWSSVVELRSGRTQFLKSSGSTK